MVSLLHVLDADAEVEGAPGAPLDVCCLDANKDYIIVSWKQPAVDGGNSILGYFVDRSVIVLMPVTPASNMYLSRGYPDETCQRVEGLGESQIYSNSL